MRNAKCGQVALILLMIVASVQQAGLAFCQQPSVDDHVMEISLGNIVRENSSGVAVPDPLFEFYSPPADSHDRFRTSKNGLLIEQFDNSKSKTPSWDAGFRTLVLMKGDFRVDLNLSCKIEEPSSGWGQGLYMAVAFDDLKATEYRLCRYAVPEVGQIAQIELTGPRVEHATYIPSPTNFEAGTLTIDRVDGLVSFFVNDGNEVKKIGEILSPPNADVRYIEIRCTRQNEGNTKARYLLKKLRIETDGFFALEADNGSRFPWFYVLLPIQFLALFVFGYFAIRKK